MSADYKPTAFDIALDGLSAIPGSSAAVARARLRVIVHMDRFVAKLMDPAREHLLVVGEDRA